MPSGIASPFITRESEPIVASAPMLAPYRTMAFVLIALRGPRWTGPIFITRSSNKWVCGPLASSSAASSSMRTMSNSVMSVVSA